MKNLFGLPPNLLYGSPRATLHSPARLPRILTDLTQICSPAVGLIDGIIGENYVEWGGDPVSSGVLIAGDNLVATDAVAARFMGVDPQAGFGTPPFILADNHIRLACEAGLGPVDRSEIALTGEMPENRLPYSVVGGSEPDVISKAANQLADTSKNAALFFKDRDHFVQNFLDEMIVIGKGKVLFHERLAENPSPGVFEVLQAENVDLYETFCKLVRAEEDELFEPYASYSTRFDR